ncbi:MAG TPA: TAXI family TRAP transporter solute-binding subunit [Rectinemataceae bacterium]|nr:TAXI family TRAP transporter solute-binding subunit [Rectinemataceae bacterium]
MKKSIRIVAVATMALALAITAGAQIKQMTMGTAGVSGTNYPTGIAMCQLWNQNIPGIKAVAIATNGSPHNIDLLRTRDIDVAQCRSLEAYRAINGIKPYPEKMPWIRAITGGLFADLFQVVARKSSGIKSVADFKGKRIAVGPIGSGGEVDARETLAAYGLTYKDMRVSFVEYTQGVEMLQDDQVDGAILGLAMGASGMTELMLDNKTIIVPITDEALANLKKVNPAYMRRNIPANIYPNQPMAVPTVGTPPDVIIVRDDLDANLVYKMTKTLYENLPTVQAVAVNLKQFTPDLVLPDDQMLVPYHPGARKYFVERGWLKP